MEPRQILHKAQEAEAMGARRFSIVTSGKALTEKELEKVAQALRLIKEETGLALCASLGMMAPGTALLLKEAGLSRYHHNLETAPSFFRQICTTHRYEEDLDTLRSAKAQGLEVCSGSSVWGNRPSSAWNSPFSYEKWRWIPSPSIFSIPSPEPRWRRPLLCPP
jgi:biotin synthase